jgi:hypothetical protein
VAHASLSKGTRNACPAGFLRGLDLQTDVLLIITDDGHVFSLPTTATSSKVSAMSMSR